ncbi:alkanonic acid methyltransferase [Halorientalis sp. IM1011]|uniref:class I SAM-dependent methyltransferase n=1 Tax=Halorientalis sp. IM1011 TaxID=1932360 RepID=UPI00097CC1DA|nr:methyltransferase domain-containing protein [Halorientalis sp. IM1011]AQL42220.1 alkanonic acid methyltransferase [Halorientalis sp. IM1011]
MADVDRVREFYGRWTGLYDRLATVPGVRSWRRRAAGALDLSPGDTVVEMGCGTGANVPYLREQVGSEGRVVGVDVTRPLLDRARERAADDGWSNVDFCEGDATQPPISGPVDAVLGTFVLGLFRDPAAVVDDWVALCRPGSRVAVLNFQRSDHPLTWPLNLAFAAFLWAGSPGWRVPEESVTAAFERRVEAGRTALATRTEDRRYETFAGGYLGLLSGRV